MRISQSEFQNVALMISTIRVAKHDDLQVCDSIFSKLAIFWVVMGLSENFTVRPKMSVYDKHPKTR